MKVLVSHVNSLYCRFKNLILYGLIGSFCAGIDFGIFFLLHKQFGIFYLTANIISVSAGITLSFLLNRKFNFKVEDKGYIRFLIFFSIGFTGLLVSLALLYLFIDIFGLNSLFSKFLSIILVVFSQFMLNKTITFRKNL